MKKLLAIVISMAMIVAMMPMGVFAAEEEVAEFDNQKYSSLEDAYNAMTEKGGGTIKLLKNCSGNGLGKDEDKNANSLEYTIDFNGYTYTVTENTVGSTGTVTQGFRVLKGSKAVLKNGTLKAGAGMNNLVQFVHTYGDVTLQDFNIDASDNQNTVIAFEADCGEVNILGNSSVLAYEGKTGLYVAFWHTGTYDGTSVNINTTGKITGKLVYEFDERMTGDNAAKENKAILKISNGKFNITAIQTLFSGVADEKLKVANISITGGTFNVNPSAYMASEGNVICSNNGDGTWTVGEPVATIDGTQYASLQAAINAANDVQIVALIDDFTGDVKIAEEKKVVLDLRGNSFNVRSDCGINVLGELTIKDTAGSGKIECDETPIKIDGASAKVTLENGQVISKKNYGVYCKEGGTAIVNGGEISSLDAALTGNNTTGDMNFEVNGGTLTAGRGPVIYMPGQVKLKITDGTLNGGISLRMGQVDISGGIINAITENIDSPAKYYDYSGNAWMPDALYVFGGTYASENAAYGNSLNLNITGGTFNCQNEEGSAVAIYDLGKVNQKMNVSISGNAELNTIATGRNAYDVLSLSDIGVATPKAGFNNPEYTGKVTTNITGGMFSTDPSKYVPEGYTAAKNANNKFVVSRNSTGGAVVPPATDNVTNNTTDKNTTADLTPAVKDNKAETTVDAKTADKIVEKALENKSTEVIVDATGNNTVASSEVAIPEKTVKELAEKTDANLVIKTDNGKVDLDKTALEAVAEQAGTDGTVKLVVETVKTDENICHVDLKLITSNGAVKDFRGGNVKVTINLTKELAAKDVVCVYINDNGIYTLVNGQKNADGTYTFTTGHFSEYAVMAKAEADKKIAEQLDTMIKDVNLKVRTSKTAKKNIKAVVSGDVKAITDAGYTVKYKFYRSEKKASKYEAKATKAGKTYINTAGKKGTKYYYKAKALVYDGDKLVGQTVLTQCKYGVRTWSK